MGKILSNSSEKKSRMSYSGTSKPKEWYLLYLTVMFLTSQNRHSEISIKL